MSSPIILLSKVPLKNSAASNFVKHSRPSRSKNLEREREREREKGGEWNIFGSSSCKTKGDESLITGKKTDFRTRGINPLIVDTFDERRATRCSLFFGATLRVYFDRVKGPWMHFKCSLSLSLSLYLWRLSLFLHRFNDFQRRVPSSLKKNQPSNQDGAAI